MVQRPSTTPVFILAGGAGERLFPLTQTKPKPAVSFGGTHQILDFTLSNCVNSGLRKIFVLTQHQREPLHDYVRESRLQLSSSFRCHDGEDLRPVPPVSGKRYRGTADAVFQNLSLIRFDSAEHVLIASGDHVYSMDYRPFISRHIASGAEVTIAYRRERKDMPAFEEEIADALAEGIELKELVAPKSIRQTVTGLVLELDVCELKDFDRSGRRRPVPIEGAVVTQEYDTIFSAIGQASDLEFAGSIETKGNTIAVDRHHLLTNLPGVFAGGDAVSGPARVVDALAHGKRAAVEIDRYLAEKAGRAPYEESLEKIQVTMTLPKEITEQPMAEVPKLDPEERIKDFAAEVELGFDEETARKECGRCLRCDVSWIAARDKSMALAGVTVPPTRGEERDSL